MRLPWNERQRAAWAWPRAMSPAQWAEKFRTLGEDETSEPGPYRLDRTPYWQEPLDRIADPTVEEIVVLKGAQVGWSEVCRNALGFWIDRDPAPILILAPDRNMAQAYRDERLSPLLLHTKAVARHLSTRAWDTTKQRIKLDSCSIYMAWAGSKSGTKSRPIGRLICEEPDEYPPFSSTGGDPLSKAEKRLTTFRDKGRAKLLIGGTPTHRGANTWKRWEACGTRYYYWCPCPHCGRYQQLLWKRVKWASGPEGETHLEKARRIGDTREAWYECEHCGQKIVDEQKPAMLRAGRWIGEQQIITTEGSTIGPERRSRRIGYILSCLYSPWVTFAQLASEWLGAQGDIEALADFVNQRLAEPFEQQVEAPRESDFLAKAAEARNLRIAPGIVPAWAGALFLTVDVQQSGMWCVVRAWGHAYRSRLIWYGFVRSFDEVYALAVRLWPVEGVNAQARAMLALIDSGGGSAQDAKESRTQEVYRFCERAPGLLLPIKGASIDQIRTVRASPFARSSDGRPVPLYTIHTGRCKDELMRLVRLEGTWELHAEVEAEYLAHMVSEHKIRKPDGKMAWKQKGSADNHLFDCEVYQIAAADSDLGGVGRIPDAETLKAQQQAMAQRPQPERPSWMPEPPRSL